MASDNKNRIFILAGIFVILGLLIAITPWYLFPICGAGSSSAASSGMTMGTESSHQMAMTSGTHMKCWYTGEAETGVGAILVLTGLALLVLQRRVPQKVFGILAIILGIGTVLIPTIIIGVCKAPDAPCRTGTLPALVLFGILTLITGLYLVLAKEEISSQAS